MGRVSVGFGKAIWWVSGGCLEGVGRISGGFGRLSGGCGKAVS